MAGHIAAMRALKARAFDPFGEGADSDPSDSASDSVEPAGDINSDDEKLMTRLAPSAVAPAPPAPPPAPPPPKADPVPELAALEPSWTATCSAVYDDDDTEVFCVRFSPDDAMLAVGCADGVVRVFNADCGKLLYVLQREASRAQLPTTCIRFRPVTETSKTRNVLLVGNADGTVQHWHITSRKCMHTITEENNQIYALDYRPDATQFATGGKDFAVRIYDEGSKSLVATLCGGYGKPGPGHSNRVFALKFHPEHEHMLISAGWDNTVQLWDLRNEGTLLSLYGPHVCGDSIDVCGDALLTGSWRPSNQLQLWSVSSGELEHDVPFKTAAMGECQLYAAQFSKPGSPGERPKYIAAGGSGANELRLFSAPSREALARLPLPRGVYGIDFSHSGRTIAVAGGDSIVRVMWLPGAAADTAKLDAPSAAAAVKAAAPVAAGDEAAELDALDEPQAARAVPRVVSLELPTPDLE